MKRKINRVGVNTLTISLPAKWVKKYKLNKGDELELFQKNNDLVISTSKSLEGEKTIIDITGFNSSLIWRHVQSAYISGYDEIELIFKEAKVAEVRSRSSKKGQTVNIYDVLSEMPGAMIGFEMIYQGDKRCVLKELGSLSNVEFDSVLRRLYTLVSQLGKECYEALKKDEDVLEAVIHLEGNVNKFARLCMRIINKSGYPEQRMNYIMYRLIDYLEEIGDRFFAIAKIAKDTKIGKDDLSLLSGVLDIFDELTTLFYKQKGPMDLYPKKIKPLIEEKIRKRKNISPFTIELDHVFRYMEHIMDAKIELDVLSSESPNI